MTNGGIVANLPSQEERGGGRGENYMAPAKRSRRGEEIAFLTGDGERCYPEA